MSIILDALKKIGSAGPSHVLDDFRKRAGENNEARRGQEKPVKKKAEELPAHKSRLKVVGPEKERVVEKTIHEVKEKVNLWPAWAQGLGLGLGIVIGVVLVVSLGKFAVIGLNASDRSTGEINQRRSSATISPLGQSRFSWNSFAGFWANPVVWSSSRPKETSSSIRKEIGQLLGTVNGSDSSWVNAQFQLSGIIVDKSGEEIAIINDRLLKVGDRINGARIRRIKPESVELSLLDQVITLELS